ncbi:MAG: type II secretion system protein GspM [Thermodesulfovibrionales bacterium]
MKKSRTMILGIPLMLILAGYSIYNYGYLRVKADLSAIRDDKAVKAKLLDKYLTLIAERPVLDKKLAVLKEERQADNSRLIEGQTPSLSAAILQETLKGIIVNRGGSISSERVGKPEDLGKFKIISVSMDAVLPDTRALGDILYSIETRTPYIVVKELDARTRNLKDPKDLTVKLDVLALTGGK